jgi:ribose 5-phosphate isomerase A
MAFGDRILCGFPLSHRVAPILPPRAAWGHVDAMSAADPAKLRAAQAGAAMVESGMTVGLGSGTTATEMVRQLAGRIDAEGLKVLGVPTSVATAELARSLGIPLRDLDDLDTLDLNLDGADEVDAAFRMIKGRGGAFLREKIVACAARRRVTMITAEKRVEQLGTTMPIPVEISLVGRRHTERRLRRLGAETAVRTLADGSPYLTDGGNAIVDCRFPALGDPACLNARLRAVVGVFETGLFIGLCDVLVVGHADRAEVIEGRVRE